MWRRFEAGGVEWEVRSVPGWTDAAVPATDGQEVLEFHAADGNYPPRSVVVEAGILAEMSDEALRAAFQRALPVEGDSYGRPGKRMGDVAEP